MAKSRKTARKPKTKGGNAHGQPAQQPSPHDVIRKPDITAFASLGFECALYVKVTHPEYMPHEVMALVKQGQVQLDPIAPGQVGTLILEGFPYTVLGYYTFSEREAEFVEPPREPSFHGPFYDFYRRQSATFQDMVDAAGEEFDKARQATRELRENMAKIVAKRQKRRQH